MELVKSPAEADGINRVALVGRLDLKGLHDVDIPFHAATASRGLPTIVDCRQLEFVASLGMGMIFSCAHSLKGKGRRMVLLAPPAEVAEALRTAGIDQAAPIVADEAAAIAAVTG